MACAFGGAISQVGSSGLKILAQPDKYDGDFSKKPQRESRRLVTNASLPIAKPSYPLK
jgi:hypothetical protein